MKGRWNDPDIADKFRAFFLEMYRVEMCAQETRPPGTPSGGVAVDGEESPFYLDLDNLPEEHLPPEQYLLLLKERMDVRRWLDAPLQETDDPLVAGIVLTQHCILEITRRMIELLLLYLLVDSRFHPDRAIRAKAIGLFTYEGGVEEVWRRTLGAMTACMAGCNLLADGEMRHTLFVDEIRLLHLVGDVSYDTLQSVFPIRAVTKCRMAFTLLMANLGTNLACNQVENYIRRRKTLYREMVAYEANGGAIGNAVANSDVAKQIAELTAKLDANTAKLDANTAKLDANTAATTAVTKKVENMDRNQRSSFAFLKNVIIGFIHLFRPGAPSLTREVVAEALLPSDRYAALAKYTEPRRSQLKAVIDMTYAHPIVLQEGKRGVLTLASVARDVWDREHLKWDLIPGSFATYEQLKAACYALAEKPKTNPFRYAH